MPFSLNSTVREILANEQAKAVVERHLPGASTHPDLPQALHMTLRDVSYYPESGLTQAKLKAIEEDLKKLP